MHTDFPDSLKNMLHVCPYCYTLTNNSELLLLLPLINERFDFNPGNFSDSYIM